MSDSTTLTVRLDRSVKERLEAMASTAKRSKSYLAAEAIEEYLSVQEWQIAGIEEAIQSMDAGKGIPHEKVSAWVKSWGTDNELPKPKA